MLNARRVLKLDFKREKRLNREIRLSSPRVVQSSHFRPKFEFTTRRWAALTTTEISGKSLFVIRVTTHNFPATLPSPI